MKFHFIDRGLLRFGTLRIDSAIQASLLENLLNLTVRHGRKAGKLEVDREGRRRFAGQFCASGRVNPQLDLPSGFEQEHEVFIEYVIPVRQSSLSVENSQLLESYNLNC